MSEMSFEFKECWICNKCKHGFLGYEFTYCPFCGEKLKPLLEG